MRKHISCHGDASVNGMVTKRIAWTALLPLLAGCPAAQPSEHQATGSSSAANTSAASASASSQPNAVPSASTSAPDASGEQLHDAIDSYRFEQHQPLLKRLLKHPYAYFRFVNIRFAERVCRRFKDAGPLMPRVNLHGDAHIEQYAVTSHGRGLADYDDASSGPAVVDLVRFGVSMQLTARTRGWDPAPAIDALFTGYQQALHKPDMVVPPPQAAKRLEAEFATDRSGFLANVESLMSPVDAVDKSSFEASYKRYVALMHKQHPDLAKDFFEIRKYGQLHSGVGSALDKKYLLRIQGPSDAAEDDVVLEAKQLRDISSISCIAAATGGGAFRILLGQTRIGRQPAKLLAQVPRAPDAPIGERPFWVQAWLANYRELDTQQALRSADEMREIGHDVGAQLGRGHVMQIASPFDEQLRAAQLQMIEKLQPRMRATITDMTELTHRSWERFKAQVAEHQSKR